MTQCAGISVQGSVCWDQCAGVCFQWHVRMPDAAQSLFALDAASWTLISCAGGATDINVSTQRHTRVAFNDGCGKQYSQHTVNSAPVFNPIIVVNMVNMGDMVNPINLVNPVSPTPYLQWNVAPHTLQCAHTGLELTLLLGASGQRSVTGTPLSGCLQQQHHCTWAQLVQCTNNDK